MPLDLITFGRQLATARRSVGLTQKALADKAKAAGLDASDKYVGLLENATPHESTGEPRRPKFELVKFFARELKLSERTALALAGYELADTAKEPPVVKEKGSPVADKRITVPVLGFATAGGFTDAALEDDEEVEIPRWMLRKGKKHGAIHVRGDSMRDGGVLDGDILVIARDYEPRYNDLVVVETSGGATLKRWSKRGDKITLRPENADYDPIELHAQTIKKVHHVVGVLRAVK